MISWLGRTIITLALLLGATGLRAAADAKRIAEILEPVRVHDAVLSPDGKKLAYTVYEKGELRIFLKDLDSAGERETSVLVGKDATPPGSGRGGSTQILRPSVRAIRWVDSDQVVYYVFDSDRMSTTSSSMASRTDIRVVQADGTKDRKVLGRDNFTGLPGSSRGSALVGGLVTGSAGLVGTSRGVPISSRGAPFPIAVTPSGLTPGGLVLGSFNFLGYFSGSPARVAVSAVGPGSDPVVYEVDVATGTRKVIGKGLRQGSTAIFDAQFRPRVTAISLDDPSTFPTRWKIVEWQDDVDAMRGSAPIAESFQYDSRLMLAPHSIVLGVGADPDILFAASNVGRPTWRVLMLNLKTRQTSAAPIEDPDWDLVDPRLRGLFGLNDPLVRDRDNEVVGIQLRGLTGRTAWLNPDLDRWQAAINKLYPQQSIKILEWDGTKQRVLAQVGGAGNPGRYEVIEWGDPLRVVQSIPRAPKGSDAEAEMYSFVSQEGVRITGALLKPKGVSSPPLLLYCQDIPGSSPAPEFDAYREELHAYVALGYAVATVNYRGSFGLGSIHLGMGRAEADRMAAEDLRDAAIGLGTGHGVDGKRVGLVGLGTGGYLALRAADLFPDYFKGVVAVNAPSNVKDWLGSMAPASPYMAYAPFLGPNLPNLVERAGFIKAPTMLVYESGVAMRAALDATQMTRLRDALRKAKTRVEYLDLVDEFTVALPAKRAETYVKIGKFLDGAGGK